MCPSRRRSPLQRKGMEVQKLFEWFEDIREETELRFLKEDEY